MNPTIAAAEETPRHVLNELGFSTRRVGEELHGTASITPQMHVPGTSHLRTSILATWADMLTGLLATRVIAPRVPVTLELDVHLYRPAPAAGDLVGIARTVKAGRSTIVAEVDFTVDGEPLAISKGLFMMAPDPDVRLPPMHSLDSPATGARLAVPLAERVGCERRGAGTAALPRREDGLNATDSVNGGLIALVAEEAVLSLAPGDTLRSLSLTYLHAARVGPVVATARLRDGLARAELRDSGHGDRLTGLVTARTFRG
ncbi:hotdog domain-containing protein [Spirillospora sp. NPDC029432]|uniref:PaaI family thioesterase n=1 Tax=Spirillospora sp. NPDC029432 TaxID=3154599 RepID=UPI003456BA86